MYIRSWTTILFLVLFVAYIDTQFIDNPPGKEDGCSGGIAYFNWTYISNSTPVVFVEWKMNGARIASEQVISSQTFQPVPAYLGRLTKISNAQIFLRSLSTADSGTYVCEVAYSVGPGNVSNEIELTIYDELDNETEIQKSSEENGMITLKPSFLDSSITYTWQYESNVIGTGFSLAATKDGNYTLCVSEGRANCLNPTVNPCHSIDVRLNGLTNPTSTFSSDMSTAVSELLSTFSSDMSTTISEVPPSQVTTSSELSQEIVITIIISCILAAGVLILPVLLVVRQCRQKTRGTSAKNKETHSAKKHNNLTKKDDSDKPRKSKLLQKKNKKQSTSLAKIKDAQLENFAPKKKIYQNYPQTTDFLNNCGNQHIFNNLYIEGNMMLYGNRHDNYLQPHSRPINRMLNQSHYREYPGHNKGMFQYYRADNSYREQQMYQRPYVALYDTHIINDKQDVKSGSKGRLYEKNWDLLY